MTKRLVYGVGINDADYAVKKSETIGYVNGKQKQKQVWVCPAYQVWKGMLMRCYSVKLHEKSPTYVGCTVCETWLLFSNFKAWMEEQDYKGRQLDKDILFMGNKIYSPETCVFISSVVNSFVIECNTTRGDWPIGVYWHIGTQKFMAYCRNPLTKKREHLGMFTCPNEAHNAWLTRKLQLAKLLAEEQDDLRVAKALVERYENYKH